MTQQRGVAASATMYPIDSLNSTGSCNNSDDDARSLVHRAALRSIVKRKRDRTKQRRAASQNFPSSVTCRVYG